MGIGCWLRRVVVGPGGWESPRRPWAGWRQEGTPDPLDTCLRRAGSRCGGPAGGPCGPPSHLWPRLHLQAQHRGLLMSWSFLAHACTPMAGLHVRALPVRVAQCVGVRVPMCMCTSPARSCPAHCTCVPARPVLGVACPSPHLLVVDVGQDPRNDLQQKDGSRPEVLGEEQGLSQVGWDTDPHSMRTLAPGMAEQSHCPQLPSGHTVGAPAAGGGLEGPGLPVLLSRLPSAGPFPEYRDPQGGQEPLPGEHSRVCVLQSHPCLPSKPSLTQNHPRQPGREPHPHPRCSQPR